MRKATCGPHPGEFHFRSRLPTRAISSATHRIARRAGEGAAHRGQHRQAAGAVKGQTSECRSLSVRKKGFRMFMPPRCSPLAIFADEYSEPHAGTAVAILAGLTKFHQAVAQFVVISRGWSNRNRLSRSHAIFWRNDEPRSIRPLLITSILVITVATGPRLSLLPPLGRRLLRRQ